MKKTIITGLFLLLVLIKIQGQDLEAVNDKNWKWGYIDSNNTMVIPFNMIQH